MSEVVRIDLDGTPLTVSAGATLASVIMQRSERRCRTSVAGEPRGALCGMGICFECRVTVDGRPHVRSCMRTVTEGMQVRTAAPTCYDTPKGGPERRNGGDLESDVLVVGAGPAGLAAADAACRSHARVVVIDENPAVGGQIWRKDARTGPARHAAEYRRRIADAGARILRATLVDGTPGEAIIQDPDGVIGRVQAPAIVLATGARELFHPFPGWTLPGVVGVGGLQALVKGGLDVRGLRIVVSGSGPLLLAVASHLRRRGAAVVALCERASRRSVRGLGFRLLGHPRKLAQGARLLRSLRGTPILHESAVVRADGASRVERVHVDGRHEAPFDVDLLAVGDGLIPQTEAARLFGCDVEGGCVTVDDLQRSSRPGVFAAGEGTGVGGVDLALAEGAIAGHAAADDAAAARSLFRSRRRERRFAAALERAYAHEAPASPPPADTIVCRCEDVSAGDLLSAVGRHTTARDLKLQTRCGMGPCQGRICGSASHAMLGLAPDRARPPLLPVSVESLVLRGASERTT